MSVEAASIPFLTACYQALTNKTVMEDDTLYWIQMAESVGGVGVGNVCLGVGEHKPTPLEEEVVRLRVLLHEAQEEAEKWKTIVESLS